MPGLPSDFVTFLFTDIEGSTRLWEEQTEAMHRDLAHHDALLRAAIEDHHGHVFKTVGDAFYAAFGQPHDAVEAALEAQRALCRELPQVRVRMAVHTGHAEERDGDYFGPALNHVARLIGAGHGGQVLLSRPTAEAVREELPRDTGLRMLGEHRLRDIAATETIFQLAPPDLPTKFPPLNTLDVAFRRGLVRAAAVATVIIAVIAALALAAVHSAREAERARASATRHMELAQGEATKSRRLLYASQVSLAQQACDAADGPHAQSLLIGARPEAGKEDLRDFAWRYLWHLAGRDDALFTLDTHNGGAALDDVVFSPDGRSLATTGFQQPVTLWDVASRRIISILGDAQIESPGLAFSPDGRTLAAGRRDHTIQLWDVPTRRVLGSLAKQWGERGTLAFSSDGSLLAALSEDKAVKLWDVRSRREVATLQGAQPGGRCLAFSPDGRVLAVASNDFTLRIWNIASRRVVGRLEDLEGKIASVAFSPDGQTVATGASRTGKVKLWEWRSRRLAAVLMGHGGAGIAVAFAPDGRWLGTGGTDHTVRLWNPVTGQEVTMLRGHRGGVPAVAFSPDGSLLASVGWPPDGTTKVWRVPPRESDLLRGHRDGLTALTYSSDGRMLISGSADGLVKVWQVPGMTGKASPFGREIATLQPNAGSVGWISLAKGDKLLAVGNQATTITVWDLPARRKIAVLKRKSIRRSALVFSPDGTFLAFGSDPNTVRLWDAETGGEIASFKGSPRGPDGQPQTVAALAFAPDGKTLAVGGGKSAKLWDVFGNREVAGMRGRHARAVVALAFSPDGTLLATGGVEGDVKVWNVRGRTLVTTLKGHTDEVSWVGFDPDGKTLASSSDDGTLRFWNTTSWLEVATLKEPLLNPRAVAFSPRGDALAMGRVDKTIRVLPATPLPEADRQMILAWHRQRAEEAHESDGFSAAIAHLSPLIRAQPEQKNLWRERGTAYAELGRLREAEADFAKVTELAPDAQGAWFARALLQLAMRDAPGYRRICTEIVRRFRDTGRPGVLSGVVWHCVAGPGALNDPGMAVRLAEKELAGLPGDPGKLYILGAALCRAGRLEDAVQRLHEAIAAREQKQAWPENELFLAITQCRLGQWRYADRFKN